ncbi:MAG: class I SAM-dependent methyltransferase [Asticcacaulis sp.]
MTDPDILTANPSASDWATHRGAAWAAHLTAMEATLEPVNAPLIAALSLGDQPLRVADLGCGGGATTRALKDQAVAGSQIDCFDISPDLIDLAKDDPRHSGLSFFVADLSVTVPPAAAYDRLVSRFGMMFFDDPAAAFANLRPWLTPGGVLAFAVWGRPEENPWMTVTAEVIGKFVSLPAPVADAPGPFRYADPAPLATLLTRAGFLDVSVGACRPDLWVGGGLSPAEATDFALSAFGVASALRDADSMTLAAVRAALTEHFNRHTDTQGHVRLSACVQIITAQG